MLLQSSTFSFLYECFLRLWWWIVLFSSWNYGIICLGSWIHCEWTFSASRNIHMDFFLQHRPCIYKTLTSTKTPSFCTFIQAWSIRHCARVPEFVNLKSHCFFFLHLLLQVETTNQKIIITSMQRYTFSFSLNVKNFSTSEASNIFGM